MQKTYGVGTNTAAASTETDMYQEFQAADATEAIRRWAKRMNIPFSVLSCSSKGTWMWKRRLIQVTEIPEK